MAKFSFTENTCGWLTRNRNTTWCEFLHKEFSVKMVTSSAYHPQTNGLDERTNQTLKKYDTIKFYTFIS